MTPGKTVLCLAALAVGAGLSLARQWRAEGKLTTQSIIIAAVTMAMGVVILFTVRWWANRPERGERHE